VAPLVPTTEGDVMLGSFLVHGDPAAAVGFQTRLARTTGVQAHVARAGQVVGLSRFSQPAG
jgi:hypothetical protein